MTDTHQDASAAGEVALLKRIWDGNRDEVLAAQCDFEDASKAIASLKRRLPRIREIAYWARNEYAGVTLSLVAEALAVAPEDLFRELFRGVNAKLMAMIDNTPSSTCPLCERKR